MSINIAIVDDHKMIREGLKQLLELNHRVHVIGMASDGKEYFQMPERKDVDVLLLDINMPNMNGMETLKKLKKEHGSTKVIMLTVHNEVEYLCKAKELGANGYILKDAGFEELSLAIDTVMEGKEYIQPQMQELLEKKKDYSSKGKSRVDLLTDREIEVLILIAQGLSNKEIADHLTISERTVKNHLSSIFKKIDVADRTQAAVYAIKNEIVKL